jgi:hypothetical protein
MIVNGAGGCERMIAGNLLPKVLKSTVVQSPRIAVQPMSLVGVRREKAALSSG